MKEIKIYIKKTPISDWQYIGTVHTYKHANQVQALAAAKGYYTKVEE